MLEVIFRKVYIVYLFFFIFWREIVFWGNNNFEGIGDSMRVCSFCLEGKLDLKMI